MMAMGGRSSEQLQQHARNAFEASERLLGQASNGGSGTERFYRAANRYATTLRTLGGVSSGRGGGATAATTSGTGGDSMHGGDLTSITLINHGVKEALDALQLKQMVRMIGAETTAGRALMDHARQMDGESAQAIDAFAQGDGSDRSDASGSGRRGSNASDAGATGSGTTAVTRGGGSGSGTGATGTAAGATSTSGDATGAGRGAAGAGGGTAGTGGNRGSMVQMLVQQSREVLQAIRELDGASGDDQSGRDNSGSNRNASGTGNREERPR